MIIGISGKIGSGKDTFADFIKKFCPELEGKSFAYKLKKIGAYLTGTDEVLWFTQNGKNIELPGWDMTIGEFQQKLGTDAARDGLHPRTWELSLFADYKPEDNWIITDVRFPNEADAIKNKNGILIRLNGDPAKVRANSKRNLFHPSETSLDKYEHFDYVFHNEGPIGELEGFARGIAKYYGLYRT